MFEDVTFGIGERPSWLKHFAFCAQSCPLITASRSSCFLRYRRELITALSASNPYKAVGGSPCLQTFPGLSIVFYVEGMALQAMSLLIRSRKYRKDRPYLVPWV